MQYVYVPINWVNAILCVIIFFLGYISYKRTKKTAMLLVGTAFAFFAISHFISLLNLQATLANFLAVLRISAYLLVMIAVGKDLIK
ncbi:MAG: hypothetical protein PHW46_05625 [Candidatus Omnitrophica bacterium]|nr:hypothetical protein [Candidatus Omnitrophota bacterium]